MRRAARRACVIGRSDARRRPWRNPLGVSAPPLPPALCRSGEDATIRHGKPVCHGPHTQRRPLVSDAATRDRGPAQPDWARRVPQRAIRALYQSFGDGALDDDLLREVGWALWARARDVIAVSVSVRTGIVVCPTCGGQAQRLRRQRHHASPTPRHVQCERCGHSGEWRRIRDALRASPRCLSCLSPLRWCYAAQAVTCPECEATLPFTTYTRRLRARVALPCPVCSHRLRAPRVPIAPDDQSETRDRPEEILWCARCGTSHPWSLVRHHWRSAPICSCGAPMVEEDGVLVCGLCGKTWTRAQFSRVLARRRRGPCPRCGAAISRERDTVLCASCGGERPWSHFRRQWHGRSLLTGVGVPACERFVKHWQDRPTAMAGMLAIDAFVHELHYGPLAPLLVRGGRESVLSMLDDLAGVGRPQARGERGSRRGGCE